MLLAYVTIPLLLVNIIVETKNIIGKRQMSAVPSGNNIMLFSEPKKLPRQLYEEFFQLINKDLVWNDTMALDADQELAGRSNYTEYLKVSLEREVGYPLFTEGVDVLLTLQKVWTTEDLDEIMDLCEGTKYGCNYEYRRHTSRNVFVRVLCFFNEEDQ